MRGKRYMPMEEITMGCIKSPKDVRDYMYQPIAMAVEYPKKFELSINRIKNQGSVGSCVAHALSSMIEYFNKKQLHADDEMSVGFIYGNRTTSIHRGPGMVIRDALKAVLKNGDVPNTLFPYNVEVPEIIDMFNEAFETLAPDAYPFRISSYFKINEKDVKHCLMNNGPVVIYLEWFSKMPVIDGILTKQSDSSIGGHCVLITGWDDEKGWLIHNSWDKSWGVKGKAYVPFDMKVGEFWGVTDNIVTDTYKIKKGNIITNIFYKLINLIANLINKFQK